MSLRNAQLVLIVVLLGLAAQVGRTWSRRVDVTSAERYGRGLRAAFALELALTAEVMRAQSGLVGHYDGLVDIEAQLKAQLQALREPPRFLTSDARAELERAIVAAERARRITEERVEQFKSEHALLRNSLRFLPVASRALDGYAATTLEAQRLKESASALVRDVLLLHAVNDEAQLERVSMRLSELASPAASGSGPEPIPELALVLLHAGVARDRAPRIAALVRQVVERTDVMRADELGRRYESFVANARAMEARDTDLSYGLLLLSVLLSALAVILRLRSGADALRRTGSELEQAVASLRVEQEKQRELAELKSRFVSMTSHEFRTPLSTIMSSSELLEAYAGRWSHDKKQEHFGRIRSSVTSMIRMLDGVLMIGRSEAGKLELNAAPLDLGKLCRNAVEAAAQSSRTGHVLVLEGPDDDEPILADELLLRHVVDNLLSNAIKYSPGGSRVTLRAAREGDEIVLEVSDEGIGIPAADQARLFETFQRGTNVSSVPGTGLGLAIAKRALDLHGGSLSVASEVGAGTRFTARFPCAFRARPTQLQAG